MNKWLKILVIVFVILAIGLAGIVIYFYPQIGPAFGQPVADVSKLLNANNNTNVNNNANIANDANVANVVPEVITPTVQGPFTILGNFKIDVFAKDLNTPRVLLFDDQGSLLVSAMGEGKVYAIKSDGSKVVIASGLNNPHGLAIDNGYLYIAETNKVSRYTYDSANLKLGNKEFLFNLPSGSGHFTRTLQFGPNGFLYVSVGSSCNVCHETDERRATILKYDPSNWSYEIFAKGLRNTVFFILNPRTKQFWGNDMGRDNLGDNLPPDEFNILSAGKNYGWPICYGQKINDRNFDKNVYIRDPCADSVAPIYEYGAHNAPLGLTFIDSKKFPASWQGDLLVALHGSWNSSVPVGYKVVHLKIDGNKVVSSEDFITGFLTSAGVIGRPVDLVFGKDGALYLSDDKAGVIYRIYR
ncbi:MAG: PQQ-dependent sugar dehydrogenase [Patescibacteria group bacterium]